MRSQLLTLSVALVFLSACAPHRTLILSEPPGAMVSIDGRDLGQTPVHYDYPLSTGGQYQVSIAHPGYQPVDLTIRADKTDCSALKRWLVAGVVWSPLWLGTLFTKKLKESYLFVMKQATPDLTAKMQN